MPSIFTLPRQWAAQASGAPYAGAKLFFYQTDTEVQQSVYQDIALETAHDHPVEANDAGLFPVIYLDPNATADYRVILKSRNDTLIYDISDVPAVGVTSSQLYRLIYPRSAAEITADVTPTNYAYPPLDIRRYGAIGDGNASNSETNSTAIQTAIDVAEEQGGGRVYIPHGTFCTDAVLIVPSSVHVYGDGRDISILKKTTATASTITDSTQPLYQFPVAAGAPICVLHCYGGVDTAWSFGSIRGVGVQGDTTNPNTSAVHYGIFCNGMNQSVVSENLASYVRQGFFWGKDAVILSEISNNQAFMTWRPFYIHSGTSTVYHNNYAVRYRYLGHQISLYYSEVTAVAADSGGHASLREADTEICLAYHLYSCRGLSFHSNGVEAHNGPVLKVEGCSSVQIRNNLALDITSNHDGAASGLNVHAVELDTNRDLTIEDNRFVFATTKISGDALAGDHFNWRVTAQTGYLKFNGNRFVDALDGLTYAGWSGGSYGGSDGTATEGYGFYPYAPGNILDVYDDNGTFNPTATFATVGDLAVTYGGSRSGHYTKIGNVVVFTIDLDVSDMDFTTASGQFRIGGLPFAVAGADTACHVGLHSDDINYTAGKTWLSAMAVAGQSYLIIYENGDSVASTALTTGVFTTNNPVRIQVSGFYRTA